MTNSKAPWLTRGGAIALMAAAGIALAACSGGGGLNEDESAGLQQELEDAKADAAAALTAQQLEEAARIAAEAAQALAEAEKLKAETEKVAAETARDAAVALAEAAEKSAAAAAASAQDAADALVEALAAQVEAEAKQAEAEAARDDAEAAADEADRLRLAAERAEAAEERLRQQAEAEQDRLEQVAEDAQQQASRAQAGVALTGLRSMDSAGTVVAGSVMARYRSMTTLTTDPVLTTQRTSSAPSIGSPWSGTTLSSTTDDSDNELVVYTNIGPATRVGIGTVHDDFSNESDTPEGYLEKTIDSDADGHLIRSSSFPSAENDPREYTNNRDTADPADNVNNVYRVNGNFDGASGYFECTPTTKCRASRLGNRYVLDQGTWKFFTRDTSTVLKDDDSFMHFGWWRRALANGSLLFHTFSGETHAVTSSASPSFTQVTGAATYRGRAVGQYALHQPAGSESDAGSFTANVQLQADFGTNTQDGTLSGTVTNFSNASDWSLSLNNSSLSDSGAVSEGTVTWEIGNVTSQVVPSGTWDAQFNTEVAYAGQTPDGVTGTFTGIFEAVGHLAGAYGARK